VFFLNFLSLNSLKIARKKRKMVFCHVAAAGPVHFFVFDLLFFAGIVFLI